MEKFKPPYLYFQGVKSGRKYISVDESLILKGNALGFLIGFYKKPLKKDDFIIDSNQNLYRIVDGILLEKNQSPWWVNWPSIGRLAMEFWNPRVKIELILSESEGKVSLPEIKKKVLTHQKWWMNAVDQESADEFKEKLRKSSNIKEIINAVDPDPKVTRAAKDKILDRGFGIKKFFVDSLPTQWANFGWQKWPTLIFVGLSIILGSLFKDPQKPIEFFYVLIFPVLASIFGIIAVSTQKED